MACIVSERLESSLLYHDKSVLSKKPDESNVSSLAFQGSLQEVIKTTRILMRVKRRIRVAEEEEKVWFHLNSVR